MVYELRATNPKKSCIWWWDKVKELKDRKSIVFEPGLNVLVGANGSGKSTVLTAMARMLHCEQGGVQKATWSSTSKIMEESRFLTGVRPIHDGRPTLYCSPDKAVGFIGGGFDWGFGMQDFQNTMFHGSSGETTLQRFGLAMYIMLGHETIPKLKWSHNSNDKAAVRKFLAGNKKLPKGKRSRPTLLLDEPDRSLDMNWQIGFWVRAAQAAKSRLQIIVAAHSPLVFFLSNVNIIEMTPGYADTVKEGVQKLITEDRLQQLIKTTKPVLKPTKKT